MQIHRTHQEHFPSATFANRHRVSHSNGLEQAYQPDNQAAESLEVRTSGMTDEVLQLVQEMRSIEESDHDALQFAQVRLRTGELFTRDSAESVATSILRELNY